MQPLDYKSPKGEKKTFAAWVDALRRSSGAYVIRGRFSHKILYVGESHTGNLASTIKRHFYNWHDEDGRKHFVCSLGTVEIAVRLTPPGLAAQGAQNNLIQRLQPKKNKQGFEPDPF